VCSRLLGYESSELIGNRVGDVWEEADWPSLIQSLSERSERTITYRIPRKDGTQVWLETTFKRLQAGAGDPEVIAISRDVTAYKQAQAMLQHSKKLSVAGQLAAGIAHEIRNPLTALKGFVQLMKAEGDPKGYLAIMLAELNRVQSIVGELLVLSKPQEMHTQILDPVQLVQHVVTLLESQATLNNIRILTDFPIQVPGVQGDGDQLKQVFINLLKNAIEAMPGSGDIQIRMEREDGHLTIRFIDQGLGIPQDMISRLGEPFYTTKEKGTGLGLMVCYKIIEDHQGRIHIESEPNVGTTIDVVLPLHT
jgi:two-component system sporulation sensor kinase A